MAKKKIREEIRKPDIVIVTLERIAGWVKSNPKTCIIAAVIALVIGLSGWGYAFYQSSKDEKVQYMVAEGITNFQQYTQAKKEDALGKAEAAFQNVIKEGSQGPKDVARLYLAQIASVKGKNEEAKAYYNEIIKNPANDLVKKLSETALQEMTKKDQEPLQLPPKNAQE
jgi:hypothetical protein